MTNSNVSPVMVWAENAVELEKGFLPAVVEAIDQFENGNRTDLSILFTVSHGIKTDLVPTIEGERMSFATPLKKIVGIIMPGLTFKHDKNKASGVSYVIDLDATGDGDADLINREAFDALCSMAEGGYTAKSKMFKAFIEQFGPRKVVTDKSPDESAEKAEKDVARLIKAARDNGHNAMAYINALVAQAAAEQRKNNLRIAAE